MAKTKKPFFSLKAQGGLGDAIAMRHSRGVSIAEKKPIPEDIKSLAQLSWRHMYQKAAALWHALSSAEKWDWESQARRRHMTGFAWFMSQALKPNPGLYLPLQGGTMTGDINMDSNKVTGLPNPTQDNHAARKKYVDDAAVPPDYPMKLKPALTRYVTPGWYWNTWGSLGTTAGRIYYIPIFVSETTTYTAICLYVGSGSAGTADLRIFNWANGLPTSLVLSAGTVNTTTTGAKEIVISQQLTRGYYFLAVRLTATPSLMGPSLGAPVVTPVSGFEKVSLPRRNLVIPIVDTPYADPAPAPTDTLSADAAFPYLKET